jgi:hypothetical protein
MCVYTMVCGSGKPIDDDTTTVALRVKGRYAPCAPLRSSMIFTHRIETS